MSELLIHHYDDEAFVTVEAIGGDCARILRDLGAQHVVDARYKLPVEKLGEFCDRRFGVERVTYRKPPITDEQRAARSLNMKRAIMARWAKDNDETQEKR